MGIPATGRQVAVKGMVIDRVVDGKWKDSRILIITENSGAICEKSEYDSLTIGI